jgi:hypothetical protein
MGAFMGIKMKPPALASTPVPFGDWMPDTLSLNTNDAQEALNVLPRDTGYSPMAALAPVAGLTLPMRCTGAFNYVTAADTAVLYAGTQFGLYVRQGSTFVESFTNGAPLGDVPDALWRFAPYGDYIVAVHPQHWPRYTSANGSSPFQVVGGNPPFAKCVSRVSNFLVLGNLNEVLGTEGYQPQRIRWGAFNQINGPWDSSPYTQADFNDMPAEGGAVMGFSAFDNGTVFQEKIISSMTYVGLPNVFQFATIEVNRGALCTGGIVTVGQLLFFIAEDGFFVWNGVNTSPIGNEKVNRYFFGRLNYAYRACITGAHDIQNKCVRWAFPTSDADGGILTETVVFYYGSSTNWYNLNGKWSHSIATYDTLVSSYRLGTSLDDLTGDLDTDYPISFDDPSFARGSELIGGFDANHNFGYFNGPNLAATIETMDLEAPNGSRIFVNSARPIVDNSGLTVSVTAATRDQYLGSGTIYGAPALQERNGECSLLAEGRFMRFRLDIQAGANWSHAQGIEVWRMAGGRV